MRELLLGCTGFEWDDGNATRNWDRHEVSNGECEEVFFGAHVLVAPDAGHSQAEVRYYALGTTAVGRLLFVAFTVRGNRIRIISARPMGRQERSVYEWKQE